MPKAIKNNYQPLVVLALLAVTFFVYSPVVKHEFLNWDDGVHLCDNLSVRGIDGQHLSDIFTSYVNDIYIPLTTLSFAVEYHFFGFNPFIYHLNNLILHALIVLLVFVIGQRLGLSAIAAGLGALIFAIHPTHVESVAWITERKDVLYSFFYLLAVCFYLKYTASFFVSVARKERISYGFLWAAGVCGALSILTKPMALSLPLVLLLIDWFEERGINRRTIVEKIPLFVVIAFVAWATYAVQARVPGESVVKGVLVWFWTLAFYVRQFILPLVSVPVYRLAKPVSFSNPEYILSIFIIFLLIFILFRYRKNKWFIFAIGYLFLSIFFLLRFDDKADINVVADRFIYLPSMGLCLWLGYVIEKFGIEHPKKVLRNAVMVTAAAVLALWGIQSYSQAKIWHDNIVLWNHELKYFPQEPIALNNLATALRDTDPYKNVEKEFRRTLDDAFLAQPATALKDEARFEKIRYIISLYEQALAADRSYVDAVYNLGNLYRDIGLSDEAIHYYQEAIARDKNYKNAYFNLGGVYVQRHDPAKAVEYFDRLIALEPKREVSYENILVAYNKALKENPGEGLYQQAHARTLAAYNQLLAHGGQDAYTYFKMGYVYQDMKDYAQAIKAYKMSLDLDKDNYEVFYNLGNTYEESGQLQEALDAYKKVVALRPQFADVYLNMGIAYNQLGLYADAEKSFLKAAEVPAKKADAFFNLGYVYEVQGKKDQALEAYGKAVVADPNHAEAYYNMGNVYVALEKLDQALESYKRTLAIKPQHLDAVVNSSIISFQAGKYQQAVYYCDEAVKLGYKPEEEYLKALQPYR